MRNLILVLVIVMIVFAIGVSVGLSAGVRSSLSSQRSSGYSPETGGYSKHGAPMAPHSPYKYLVGKTVEFDKIGQDEVGVGVVKWANGFQVGVHDGTRERSWPTYGAKVKVMTVVEVTR